MKVYIERKNMHVQLIPFRKISTLLTLETLKWETSRPTCLWNWAHCHPWRVATTVLCSYGIVLVESKYELIAREPQTNCKKSFMMFSCTITREEHIKSRHKSEHQKDCKFGVKDRWSPMAIMHECVLNSSTSNQFKAVVAVEDDRFYRLSDLFCLRCDWPSPLAAYHW